MRNLHEQCKGSFQNGKIWIMMDPKELVIRITVRGHGRLVGFLSEEGLIVPSRGEAAVYTIASIAASTARAWNDMGSPFTFTPVPRCGSADRERAEKAPQAVQ